ncbi:DNA-processing protein DprA [Clostridium sp. JNZ J1-5]
MKEDYLYWIWLNELKGIGPVTAKKLLSRLVTPERIYNATKEEIRGLEDIGDKLVEVIIQSKDLNSAKRIIEECKKQNIDIVTYEEKEFPSGIKSYPNMPILLYYKGNLYEDVSGVAIVGSRRCSDYGKQVTVEAAKFLAENKIPVISGMAKGIDSYAHTACIKSGGYTMAFLGCGLDICYPKEHYELMKSIVETGVIISEYAPGVTPSPQNFPKRNRLISACCQKILTVEAGEKSGALITAEYAKEQNKEVFAVPNSIYSKESKGTNKLISEGASIYLNTSQLIINNTMNFVSEKRLKNKSSYITDEERHILTIIKSKAYTIDEIIVLLKVDKSIILDTLFSMELEGKVKCVGGKYFS